MPLHHIALFRRHHQRCPLPRAPSHICAGLPLVRRCSNRLSLFCCQQQRCPLTRAPSHICAGPPRAYRLYFNRLNRFCCQRLRYPLTQGSSRTFGGKHSLTRIVVKNKRRLPREPQTSLGFVVDKRLTLLLHCCPGGQQVPRKSWHIRKGNHLH